MRLGVMLLAALVCSGADLEHQIDALADSSGAAGRGSIGIHVVDAVTGKTVYRRNEDKLFLPASNMKLFTSALALLRLGPEYRFTTRVTLETPGETSGATSGSLVLSGGGDPSLSGRVFPYQKDAAPGPRLRAIEDLADQTVAAGIRRVEGDIVGDDSLYPWAPYAPSWTQDDALREFGAPVSALTLGDNVITLSIRPAVRIGDPAEISVEPALEYYTIDNRLTTVARGAEANVRMSRLSGSRELQLWGAIPAGHAAIEEETAIDDPALYAAEAFYDALIRRGVAITGRARAKHRSAAGDYQSPDGAVVASRISPPLDQLLQTMEKVSQNLYAELILREVGLQTRHSGTREAGLEELGSLLTEIGAPRDEARIEDGSGLSRNTLVTPRLMTRLLVYLQASRYRDTWISLLPAGGEDGTLQHRLCCVTDAGGIRAKTGSLSRALALSGYADSKTHGRLAFAILVNNFSAPASEVRSWIDKIALLLLE
jgi:D-alanyl-D-alanine carboxypeptidase/D-alanyl-D-alanine-endopeptidase (penicillin-binding protein 4)